MFFLCLLSLLNCVVKLRQVSFLINECDIFYMLFGNASNYFHLTHSLTQ